MGQSLGEKLREARGKRSVNVDPKVDRERKRLRAIRNGLDDVKEAVLFAIEDGKSTVEMMLPHDFMMPGDSRTVISLEAHRDHDIWEIEFLPWLTENGLVATVGCDRDRDGMASWHYIKVQPSPEVLTCWEKSVRDTIYLLSEGPKPGVPDISPELVWGLLDALLVARRSGFLLDDTNLLDTLQKEVEKWRIRPLTMGAI